MKKNILLFDGVCNLCNGAVQFIIKRDRKNAFQFASLQSDSGQKLLEKFGLPAAEFHSLILIQEDHYFMKSAAVLKIARQLGNIWKMFYAFILVPRPIRDFFYDMIARSRYRIFGKRDVCMVPAPDLVDKFL